MHQICGRHLHSAFASLSDYIRIERKHKGDFVKRAVLANVPSYRFLVPSFRFLVPRNRFLVSRNRSLYPRSGFWYRGTFAKTTLLETTLLRTPELRFRIHFYTLNLFTCNPGAPQGDIALRCFSPLKLRKRAEYSFGE